MTGQDSEQATGAASARTCARDVPQNRVDWPLLIVLGIQILAPYVFFLSDNEKKNKQIG